MTFPTPAGSVAPSVLLGFIAGLAVPLALTGCALSPDWQQTVRHNDLEQLRMISTRFDHVVLRNRVRGRTLALYIEGDGIPWIGDRRVSIDPTPSNPVLLRLMTRSTAPAAYVGRPCYFGTATSRSCDPRYWTFERYGVVVVESMCEIANRLIDRSGAESVVLVGYSGGATIAQAMRSCTRNLDGFVSLGGNLDPETWTTYHGYSPLVDLPPLVAIPQFGGDETHWQCTADEVVPPVVTDRYFAHNPKAQRRAIADCTHASGWASHWRSILP